ncbi:MAG: UvrD-helicase domain-containing protein, partial [Gammaproteobacteria bacterium]|nr:UvrD-helicase domain-containing protein [Gammaproteobacteria bacterium]
MKIPNIRLCVNIICESLVDEKNNQRLFRLEDRQMVRRIGYWELLELSRQFPLRFSQQLLADDQLTLRQREQRDAYLQPFQDGIWPRVTEFKLIRFGASPETQPLPPPKPQPRPAQYSEKIQSASPAVAAVVVKPSLPAAPTKLPTPAPPVLPSLDQGVVALKTDIPAKPAVQSALKLVAPSPVPHYPAPASIEPPRPVVALDSEQYAAVHTPADASILVIAPPGTGKTHVLIERLIYLTERGGCQAQEVLVLSFTRAAVAEIMGRLQLRVEQGAADDLRFVNVRTFDSLATALLRCDLPPEDLQGQGYDGRIDLLNERLHDPTQLPEAQAALGEIRVLLVDEIQDLVGRRAAMVLNLIQRVRANGGSVTLLGDPAQAIYDFQAKNEPGSLRCADFLESIRGRLVADIKSRPLTQYRRFVESSMITLAERARAAMGEDGLHPDGTALEHLLDDLESPAELDNLQELAESGERAAILVRTNLEAAQLAEWCRQHSVAYTHWRGRDHDHWPGWIARLVYGFQGREMSRDRLTARWQQYIGDSAGLLLEEALTFLERQDVLHDNLLDLKALTDAMNWRAPYRNAGLVQVADGLIISTIHKSKGLEFDRVLLLEPDSESAGNPEEVRVLYVAATRARRNLRLLARDRRLFPKATYTNNERSRLGLKHLMVERGARLLLEGLEDVESPRAGINFQKQQNQLWQIWAGSEQQASFMLDDATGEYWLRPVANPHLRFWRASHDLANDLRIMERIRILQHQPKVRSATGARIESVVSVMLEPPASSESEPAW